MDIDQKLLNDVCVLTPKGRLDSTAAPLLKQRLADLAGPKRRIVIDLEQVEFIDSSGLGALVSYVRILRNLNGDLKLVGLNDKIRHVFELTRAFRLFDIFDSTSAAVESFKWENVK